jgi:hypothetical protein
MRDGDETCLCPHITHIKNQDILSPCRFRQDVRHSYYRCVDLKNSYEEVEDLLLAINNQVLPKHDVAYLHSRPTASNHREFHYRQAIIK